jgi:hypothetical protein
MCLPIATEFLCTTATTTLVTATSSVSSYCLVQRGTLGLVWYTVCNYRVTLPSVQFFRPCMSL